MMNVNDIQTGEIIHDSLTVDQINKIKKINTTFEEVYPVSLEQTINDFKKDRNPGEEITIWLQMAEAYEKYLSSKQTKPDLSTKKEIYKLILCRSMMPAEESIKSAELKILTEKEANEVMSYYTAEPDPIEVVKK